MSCCYVTAHDEKEEHTTSILKENQFIDREADFCRVFSEDARQQLEKLLLRNGISYSEREEHPNPLSRIFSAGKSGRIIRVNSRNMEAAMGLAEEVRGTQIIGTLPEEDWVPVQAKKRREQEKAESDRFREEWQDEEYGEETYQRRRA